MKLGVMQPYLFPYLGYYQMVDECDVFVFYDDVDFIQRGYINRNRILNHGKASYFTVPVKGSKLGTKINEVELYNFIIWRSKFLKQLRFTYGKAPFFKEVLILIEGILEKRFNLISSLSIESISGILTYLGSDINSVYSSDLKIPRSLDKFEKLEFLIDYFGAHTMVLPPGSKTLYMDWHPTGIKKKTLQVPTVQYKQYSNVFVENLSIIDLLMFNDKDAVKSMINNKSFQ